MRGLAARATRLPALATTMATRLAKGKNGPPDAEGYEKKQQEVDHKKLSNTYNERI